jgi:WD40 repeat protein
MELEPEAKWISGAEDTAFFCIDSSNDNNFIAAGQNDGTLSLWSPKTGRLSYNLLQNTHKHPVTCCRFHPQDHRVLLAVASDGSIKEWSTRTSQETWHLESASNALLSVSYSRDGTKFATGGRDCHVRVYDNTQKQLVNDLSRNEFDLETMRGHCNRVQSLCFHPTDATMLLSAGWDNTVQIWDLRAGVSVRALLGVHVLGDTIDVSDQYLVTGSWRTENQIQVWDLKTFQVTSTIQWGTGTDEKQCEICAAKLDPTGRFVIAGGSSVSAVKVFSMTEFTQVGPPAFLNASTVCLAVSTAPQGVAIGTADGKIQFRHFVAG